MISASDVPACPACGSQEVHPVRHESGETLYACRQCGRDNTQAWAGIQPAPKPKPVIGPPDVPRETHRKPSSFDVYRLGIGAVL